jgi:hypothetical protein
MAPHATLLAVCLTYTAECGIPVVGGALQATIGMIQIAAASIDAQRLCGVNKSCSRQPADIKKTERNLAIGLDDRSVFMGSWGKLCETSGYRLDRLEA